MTKDINLIDHQGLVKTTIRPKQVTYYLVTEENIKNIKAKAIWSDIFNIIASISWGVYFSSMNTIKGLPELNNDLKTEIRDTILNLKVSNSIFFWIALIATILAIFQYINSYRSLNAFKTEPINVDQSRSGLTIS